MRTGLSHILGLTLLMEQGSGLINVFIKHVESYVVFVGKIAYTQFPMRTHERPNPPILFRRQAEIDVVVAFDSALFGTFRHYRNTSSDQPRQNDLCSSFAMVLGNTFYLDFSVSIMNCRGGISKTGVTDSDVSERATATTLRNCRCQGPTQRTVGDYLNALKLTVF